MRQGLKAYSEWPTYPQFYVHGSLIGGVDILAEMKADGDLKEQLGLSDASSAKDSEAAEPIESRLAKLINRAPVMLFMKGAPSRIVPATIGPRRDELIPHRPLSAQDRPTSRAAASRALRRSS